MASDLDTLNIGSIRLKKDYPISSTQPRQAVDPVLHPEAAQAARERIAAMPDASALLQGSEIPALHPSQLVTDKQTLARQAGTKPAPEKKRRSGIPSALRPMLAAAGIFLIVLLLFKAPIILSQLGYSFGNKQSDTPAVTTTVTDTVPAENTISIPKINVKAPVVYEPSILEANVQKALENGVVHYGNTSNPGEAGNVAIFGHSSNDWWEPGNYKFVFVLLDKLAPGDQVTIDYNQRRYVYEVTGSKVVEPTDVSVLNKTSEPTLTLITCTPPGTSLRRLVVTAKQISPAPGSNTAVASNTAANAQATALPSTSAPGFFTQVSNAWEGVVSGFKSLFSPNDTTTSDPNAPGSSPDTLPAIK